MLKKAIFASVIITALIISGCGKDDSMMNNSPLEKFSTNPAIDQTEVRLNSKIELNFNKPVDRSVVEKDFHLISRKAMADTTCPFGANMLHGDMTMAMNDAGKMMHLAAEHHTKGKFSWNNDNTQCVFTPDSLLMPNMQYMMHFGSSMMNMMNEKMGNMNMGNMENMQNGMMMTHFKTMDTVSTGGGHLGHH